MVTDTSLPQTGESGTTRTTVQELRMDDWTLSRWRFDSMETLFPGVQKATLYFTTLLRVDHLDTIQLPALREICLKRDPHPDWKCEFTEWPSLCKRLCSSFSCLEKLAFIDLPFGDHHAGRILSSLREHSKLTEIRYRCQ